MIILAKRATCKLPTEIPNGIGNAVSYQIIRRRSLGKAAQKTLRSEKLIWRRGKTMVNKCGKTEILRSGEANSNFFSKNARRNPYLPKVKYSIGDLQRMFGVSQNVMFIYIAVVNLR